MEVSFTLVASGSRKGKTWMSYFTIFCSLVNCKHEHFVAPNYNRRAQDMLEGDRDNGIASLGSKQEMQAVNATTYLPKPKPTPSNSPLISIFPIYKNPADPLQPPHPASAAPEPEADDKPDTPADGTVAAVGETRAPYLHYHHRPKAAVVAHPVAFAGALLLLARGRRVGIGVGSRCCWCVGSRLLAQGLRSRRGLGVGIGVVVVVVVVVGRGSKVAVAVAVAVVVEKRGGRSRGFRLGIRSRLLLALVGCRS